MPQLLFPVIPKLTLIHALDILAVATLVYNLFLTVRGRRAAHESRIWSVKFRIR